ncbi:terminase large subunit [Vibrio phage 1.239.O._10N.261.52.F6]|nr:terminase large subunit [Vibrio phage 1.239.O._10N.261.52.F6]
MQPTLNPNLRAFWETRELSDGTPVTTRTLYGGRMSSKSHDVAGMAIARANHHQENFLCTRMYQNRIADSVYTLLKNKIEYFQLKDNFKVYADAIEHKTNGSLFRFYGIARNIDEIKSYEGATVWWNEESHNLTKTMYTTIRPTIMRNEGAEMWFTFNPLLMSDYAYQRLVVSPPKGSLVRMINYDENPFLGRSALADIQAEFDEDHEQAEHIYLGVPLVDDDKAIIKRSWCEAAKDAHIKLDIDMSGGNTVGYDVADSGEDKNAVAVFDGSICTHVEEWKAGEDELKESALRAWSHVTNGWLVYDSIGVGAHTGSTLKDKGHTNYTKFNAGAAVESPTVQYAPGITNKEKFENLKAQAWQDVADRLRNTYNAVQKGQKFDPGKMISISTEIDCIESLVTELCTPHKDYSERGLDMVESKKKLAKREVKSPNKADAFIMGACPHLVKREPVKRPNMRLW